MRDERFFPEPDQFKPERHLGRDHLRSDTGGHSSSIWHEEYLDPLNYAFGFGRRICPGRHLASGSLFMVIASTLHTFNISPILNERGEKFDPFSSVITGMVSYVLLVPERPTVLYSSL